jgi:hypothetical protein
MGVGALFIKRDLEYLIISLPFLVLKIEHRTSKIELRESLLPGAVRHGFAIKMEKESNSLFWVI